MKPVLAWIKANIIIVVCAAVALIAPPIGLIFSSGMNKAIRKEREETRARVANSITGVQRVDYSDLRVVPGAEVQPVTFAPHSQLTQIFAERRKQAAAEVARVVDRVGRINSERRSVLVPGLFPVPPSNATERNRLLSQFVRVQEWQPGVDTTSAYGKLLARVQAGEPPTDEMVETQLKDIETSEIERVVQSGREATDEDERALHDKLVGSRIGQYQQRAGEISVYAAPTSFAAVTNLRLPPFQPNAYAGIPSVEQCWEWQYDYWLMEDVFEAIARANTDSSGRLTRVPRSVVKRIVLVKQDQANIVGQVAKFSTKTMSPDGTEAEVVPPDPMTLDLASIELTPSFDESAIGWDYSNALYENREVELTLIVSFAQLPKLYDAIARTRMMAIVDLQMDSVNVAEHLKAGFWYGEEFVVQARIKLHVLFLREWMAKTMPVNVKKALAVPIPPQESGQPQDPTGSESAGSEGDGAPSDDPGRR